MRYIERFAILGLVIAGFAAPAHAEPVIQSPAMNCADWKRVGFHTWTQTGTIRQNGVTWSGNTLTNTDLTRMMDMLCTGGGNDSVY